MDQWECYESNAGVTETYKIVSHTSDILVFNSIHYDYSCGEPFTTNYQYTYSVDGDILFEEIVFEGLTPSSSSYLKSQSTFAEFTKTCAQ
jgi:hypothetical protein